MDSALEERLKDELNEWTIESNQAVSLNLTRNGATVHDNDFHPDFTYAIFGEDEMIPGYKDLKVRVDFRAHDLRPSVTITHGEKAPPLNEEMRKLMDIEAQLAEFLPESAFSMEEGATNGEEVETESKWTPPGELYHTYKVDRREFQIWIAPLTDPRAKEILSNMRILIPMFIEGGTVDFLTEDNEWSVERWKLFLLYEVHPHGSLNYTLAGFSTAYRIWVFPSDEIQKMLTITTTLPPTPPFSPTQDNMPAPVSPLSLTCRERISQFMILPPHKGASHGSYLYTAMMTHLRTDPAVVEITVEEPNESFDQLRDLCDLAYLTSQSPAFQKLRIPTTFPPATLHRKAHVPDLVPFDHLLSIRAAAKLAPRQFQRLTEIHLLSTIPAVHRNTNRISRRERSKDDNDRRYYFWRLSAKERIFVRNKDVIMAVVEAERQGKLEETLEGMGIEYAERLRVLKERMRKGLGRVVGEICEAKEKKGGGVANGVANANANANGEVVRVSPAVGKKRKVIEDDDEDDEGPPAKKGGVERNGMDLTA